MYNSINVYHTKIKWKTDREYRIRVQLFNIYLSNFETQCYTKQFLAEMHMTLFHINNIILTLFIAQSVILELR